MLRRGVSLLEVMFATGVVAVGLLGVLAVLPLGLHIAGKGHVADRAARTGLNAVEEFKARGMARPLNWLYPDGSAVGHPGQGTRAFAIDPMFVAVNGATTTLTDVDPTLFPYVDTTATTDVRMQRITLRRTPLTGGKMLAPQATQIFMDHDDLIFDIPDEKLVSPEQLFLTRSSTGTALMREFEGEMSWMATVAPKLDGNGSFLDVYLLSLVVFHKRDYSMSMEAIEGPASERVVDVVDVTGNEVLLESSNLIDLELTTGDWLMLMTNLGSKTFPGNASATTYPYFKWYRVVETESQATDTSGSGTTWQRYATLQGPEWPSSGGFVTEAALFNNVVAVYEKTIRLESSGLY
jgi:hypothetical protein